MRKRRYTLLAALLLFPVLSAAMEEQRPDGIEAAAREFRSPHDSTRTKLWWFHGEGPTSREGISADLEAFKEAGVGGVVYYDQVHGDGKGALDALSHEWWEMLKFAASEAKRLGLSFEINVSNGFVAGGPWISEEYGMQRLCSSDTLVSTKGRRIHLFLSNPSSKGWFRDVAVLAVPIKDKTQWGEVRLTNNTETELSTPITARSISYTAPKARKSRSGAMQIPNGPSEDFYGMGYVEPAPAGMLECSQDGQNWREICILPTPGGSAGLAQRTVSFEPVEAKFFRVRGNVEIKNITLSSRAKIDLYEQKAAYFSEFPSEDKTARYSREMIIDPSSVIDISRFLSDNGGLTWKAPKKGDYLILRIASESTGGHIKHGRKNLMGLECDKMSKEAAVLQWNSYPKRIIDTLTKASTRPDGVIMDSHEAGTQNWTGMFPQIFLQHNGYSIIPWLPAMRGYIVGSKEDSDAFLRDVRRTIADAVSENYYGTLDSLCRSEGLAFTAQASGNGVNLTADNIQAKGRVMKPQGEFWARDTDGSYDIADCASAAHLYGKKIASAEAFTDAKYSDSPATLKMLADFAYSKLINEFVVCASAYQAETGIIPGNVAGGRQYCLNRNNTIWHCSRPFWDYQARCSGLLRKGDAVVDILIYIGDDPPLKPLSHLIPYIPEGYNFDFSTADALKGAYVKDGRLMLQSGMSYAMIVIERGIALRKEQEETLREWESLELPVFRAKDARDRVSVPFAEDMHFRSEGKIKDCIRFGHRRLSDADVYFVYNHSTRETKQPSSLRTGYTKLYSFNPLNGDITRLSESPQSFTLSLSANESVFLVATDKEIEGALSPTRDTNAPLRSIGGGTWKVSFDPNWGGPKGEVEIGSLPHEWSKESDTCIKYYSGTATYRCTFEVSEDEPTANRKLLLSGLEWVAEVSLNGCNLGIVWCSPWTTDCGKALLKGENNLEIKVTNSLYNRMIGDAAETKEEKRYTHSSYPIVGANDPLVPSGITGGVYLL